MRKMRCLNTRRIREILNMKKMIRRVVCALCAFFVLSVVLPESISEFGFFSKLSAGLAEGTAPTRFLLLIHQ